MDTEITKAQENLLKLCKDCGWGKIEVTVKNGQPVMAIIIKQEVKLD